MIYSKGIRKYIKGNLNPDYVIGFHVFTGSAAIARKSG
jgi:hypothetical protein|tara:strand:- start:1873 stop:1986 length:114 start_codon:yes stop_codon:yes gene_type:complete